MCVCVCACVMKKNKIEKDRIWKKTGGRGDRDIFIGFFGLRSVLHSFFPSLAFPNFLFFLIICRVRTRSDQDELRRKTENILQKALAVLQLTAVSQFGCGAGSGGGDGFYKNTLKKTPKGNHYG